MRQFSYTVRRDEDIDDCIRRFQIIAPKTFKSLLITIFTTFPDTEQIQKLIKKVGDAFPTAVIAGCVTTDIVQDGSVYVNSAGVSFSVFETSTVKVITCRDPETLAEDGKKLRTRAKRTKDLRAVGIMATIHSIDIQPFLDEIALLDESIVLFGGGANTLIDAPASVFTREEILDEGLLAVLFSGPELHVKSTLKFGWKPLGREFTVTKMAGNHVVEEIDHEPACRIYEKYLGITPDNHFPGDALAFPIFVKRGGMYVARYIVDFRSDGALLIIADLHEGEKVRLAYGDPGGMIEDARSGFVEMADFQPSGMFILTCLAHRMFLKDDVKLELTSARDVSPSLGYYTYGEIFRTGDSVSIHNMMMITVGFREGEKPALPHALKEDIQERLNDSLLLVDRLVHFISATTAELENANKELDRMARTDRLTQIANRGETEAALKEAIGYFQQHKGCMSALMLDLDDFKKINDSFGHDVGDNALTETAKILRAHVRAGDTVGRWGGEEFLLVLPKTTEKEAKIIAERIRKTIEAMNILPEKKKITASFGAACLIAGEDFSAFYRRLDHALYEAKHSGKNCVVTASRIFGH